MKEKEKEERTRWTFRTGGIHLPALATVLLSAVLLNLLAGRVPARYSHLDLTQSRYYSLSEQTRQILDQLDTEVTIYWVVRQGYENDMLQLLLDEYAAASDCLTVQKVDPDEYPTFLRKYTTDEARDNTVIIEKDSFYKYYDYYDIFEFVQTKDSGSQINFCGESCITSGIAYAMTQKKTLVASLSGHGESTVPEEARKNLEKENIEIRSQVLSGSGAVSPETEAILIYGPQTDLSPEEKTILLDYLSSGGRLFLVTAPEGEGQEKQNLHSLMEQFGLETVSGVVVEADPSYYAYDTPYYLLPYRNVHPIIDPLTRSGYYALMPIAGGLHIKEDLRDGLYASALLTTSKQSFSKKKAYELDTYEKEEGDTDGPFCVAAAVREAVGDSRETRILWVGSDEFLDDSVNELSSGGNMNFFLNAVDWITEKEESMIAIRSKTLQNTRLIMSSGTRLLLKAIIAVIIPCLFLAAGLLVQRQRKRRIKKS